MNKLQRMIVKAASYATGVQLDRLQSLFFAPQSNVGITIDTQTALSSTAVLCCIRVISETLAQLSLNLMSDSGGMKQKAVGNPLHRLLHEQPNPEMTSFEFLQWVQAQTLIRGAGYAEIERSNSGRPLNLWPLISKNVFPERRMDGQLIYRVYVDGKEIVLFPHQILHIKGFSAYGLVGDSLVDLSLDSIGVAVAQQRYTAAFYKNDASPRGYLYSPNTVAKNDEAKDRLIAKWEEKYGGLGNAHRTALLQEGLEWKQSGISPADSQLIEGRTFQVAEIARIFRMPLHMIGELSRATFSNIEQQAIEFVTYTMLPWVTRWEQRLNMQLIPPANRDLYFKFNVNTLLRGDSTTRANLYRQMFFIGSMNPNEIRDLEDLNPREGGDTYFVPVNMAPADGSPLIPIGPDTSVAQEVAKKLAFAMKRMEARRSFTPLFEDLFLRLIRAAAREARKGANPEIPDALNRSAIMLFESYAQLSGQPCAKPEPFDWQAVMPSLDQVGEWKDALQRDMAAHFADHAMTRFDNLWEAQSC